MFIQEPTFCRLFVIHTMSFLRKLLDPRFREDDILKVNYSMILILDNLDSFTFNISQETRKCGYECVVKRASETSLADIEKLSPQKIIFSPGPGRPSDHPFMYQVMEYFSDRIPILGICLGMQAMNEFFGGTICKDDRPMHGKTSSIFHNDSMLFHGIPSSCEVARYHSLKIDQLATSFILTAWTADRIPMAMSHHTKNLYGVQFHPESFLTPYGNQMLLNFYRS